MKILDLDGRTYEMFTIRMPKVKLTLLVDAEAVQSAKRHAHARRTSVSALATQFFQSLGPTGGRRPPSVTRKLLGVIDLPPDADDRRLLVEAIVEKHLP